MRIPDAAIAAGVWMLSVAGCSDPPSTPEQQIRDAIRLGEQAAEARDVGGLAELVAAGYQDAHGYDRRALLRLAQAYLMGHQSIHLLVRPQSIDLPSPERANVEVLVAMTGAPVDSVDELINMRADVLRFEISFEKTGTNQWQAARADWRRAELDDFL